MTIKLHHVIKAVNAKGQYEKMKAALDLSSTFDELIEYLEKSFGFTSDQAFELLSAYDSLTTGTVPISKDFLTKIERIKASKDGFAAMLFSLTHFGPSQVEESMKEVFQMDYSVYSPVVQKLLEFKQGKPKTKKLVPTITKEPKAKPPKEPREAPTTPVLYIRAYKPLSKTTSDSALPGMEYVGMYIENCNTFRLVEVVDDKGVSMKVADPSQFKVLDGWKSISLRGMYARIVAEHRRKHHIFIKKDGVTRIVQFHGEIK
jgi:hypothetical protein